jgi:type IV pilus assembly protein PilW
MNINSRFLKSRVAGFTLIEVLIGLTLGFIAIIVMYQVFAVFEGQKRTTTSGGDAQTTGLLALYSMEREARMAGYGMIYQRLTDQTAGTYRAQVLCRNVVMYSGGAALPPVPFMPVRITDGSTKAGGTAATPDDVIISYSTGPYAATPSMLFQSFTAAGQDLVIWNVAGNGFDATDLDKRMFRDDRFVFVAEPQYAAGNPKKDCARLQISKVVDNPADGIAPGTIKLEHAPPPTKIANPAAGTAMPNGGYTTTSGPFNPNPAAALVFNLGAFIITNYNIDTAKRQLVMSDVTGAAAASPIGEEVVTMQALYGVVTAPGAAISWVPATGAWLDPWNKDVSAANSVEQIVALRVAIVVRNPLVERYAVSRACNSAAPAANPDGTVAGEVCVWVDNKASAENDIAALFPAGSLPAGVTWANFRYRVYDTTVPLRNVMWAQNFAAPL